MSLDPLIENRSVWAPEAAEMLGIALADVRRLALSGVLPYERHNRNLYLFRAADVVAYRDNPQPINKTGKRAHLQPKSSIYFAQMQDARHIKIGRAVDVAERMTTLRCGNPETLRVVATMPGGASVELRFHRIFRFTRLQGEWFRSTLLLEETIQKINSGMPRPDLFDWLMPAGKIADTEMLLAGWEATRR